MSTTRPRARTPGIFISCCSAGTMTTTIGDEERQVSDDKASCASSQHILITSRDGNDDNVKCTFLASNIDATTSQATSNLDAHELYRKTYMTWCRSAPGFSSAISHCAQAHMAFSHRAQAHELQPLCASARASASNMTPQSTGNVRHRCY
jgi:hypothetical protein